MEILFLLIAISLCVALFFLGAFIWAVRSDQFGDSYGPSRRILTDEPVTAKRDQDTTTQTER